MKVGIIRCMQTEDFCPGTTDFKMIRERKGVFEGITEDIDIVGFCNCGGCPAKKSVLRARELVRRGADTIVFWITLMRHLRRCRGLCRFSCVVHRRSPMGRVRYSR